MDNQTVELEQTLNAPEQTQTPEVVTPDAEQSQEDTHEGGKEADPTAKLQARFDRRIGRATAARYQAEARAEQEAARARELAERLAQYEQQPQESEAAIPRDKVLPLAQQLAAQIRQQEKVVESVRAVLEKGKTLEGFDQACNAVDAEVAFYDRAGRPTPFLQTVMECADPARVLHHLGRNPDLAADLADLTPTQQARRLDRIEAELSKPAETKTSAAPKPITPVKGGGGGAKDYSPEMSDAEYAAWRQAQKKARHG